MPKNIKTRFVLPVLAFVLTGWGLTFWTKGAEFRSWQVLASERDRHVTFRILPGIDKFLEKELGNWRFRTSYYHVGGDFSENEKIAHGSLIHDYGRGGKIFAHFAYHELATEPDSVTLSLTLNPVMLTSIRPGEFRKLVNETKDTGELRTTYYGMEWFSYFDMNGDMQLTLRSILPNPFIEDMPKRDDQDFQEPYKRLTRLASNYLRKEAFAPSRSYVEMQWCLPHIPTPGSSHTFGNYDGFIFLKGGDVVPIRVATSGNAGAFNLSIFLQDDHMWKANPERVKALFKPEFLTKSGKEGALDISASFHKEGYYLVVSGKLRDFGKWDRFMP